MATAAQRETEERAFFRCQLECNRKRNMPSDFLYRRLTFMMLDADIVAVSPASVWRVLSRAGLLRKWNGKPSKKGTGFEQPPQPHRH